MPKKEQCRTDHLSQVHEASVNYARKPQTTAHPNGFGVAPGKDGML